VPRHCSASLTRITALHLHGAMTCDGSSASSVPIRAKRSSPILVEAVTANRDGLSTVIRAKAPAFTGRQARALFDGRGKRRLAAACARPLVLQLHILRREIGWVSLRGRAACWRGKVSLSG
jgi:hypothetical protein